MPFQDGTIMEEVVAQQAICRVVIDDEHLALLSTPSSKVDQVSVPEVSEISELIGESGS